MVKKRKCWVCILCHEKCAEQADRGEQGKEKQWTIFNFLFVFFFQRGHIRCQVCCVGAALAAELAHYTETELVSCVTAAEHLSCFLQLFVLWCSLWGTHTTTVVTHWSEVWSCWLLLQELLKWVEQCQHWINNLCFIMAVTGWEEVADCPHQSGSLGNRSHFSTNKYFCPFCWAEQLLLVQHKLPAKTSVNH